MGLRHLAIALFLAFISLFGFGQTKPASGTDQPGYVFHANAREVLTDVVVTDNNGNPVLGLPRSAFHIFDNDRPQQLDSFDEHKGNQSRVAEAVNAPNVASNAFLLHPPAAFNVILLDTTNIDVIDQMYLNQQLTRFVQALPKDQSLAVYNRVADMTVQLQNFTSDHTLLLAAIHKAIPRLRHPGAWYAADFDTLQQMVFYLRQLPGRKNVFWFSGGVHVFVTPDFVSSEPSGDLRLVYDELETERIAVYPIDARGLTVEVKEEMARQHIMMNEMAEATGGEAFYNSNGLEEIASKLVDTGADFYTLTYRPDDLKLNNKWHRVKITVDGSYHLSYRRGYFDDGITTLPQRESKTAFRVKGETIRAPDPSSDPIIFQARVMPSDLAPPVTTANAIPPKRNEIAYSVEYSLPLDGFAQNVVNGESRVTMGAAILAFSPSGRVTSHVAQEVTFKLNEQKLKAAGPSVHFPFHQQINLPKGQDYLYIAVWDMTNGRLGTLQLPMDVEKKNTVQKTN